MDRPFTAYRQLADYDMPRLSGDWEEEDAA